MIFMNHFSLDPHPIHSMVISDDFDREGSGVHPQGVRGEIGDAMGEGHQ